MYLRFVRLLALILLPVALAVTSTPAAAQPLPGPLPSLPAPSNGLCNPMGVAYCYHGGGWQRTSEAALDWSDSHRSWWQRRPVPYPAASTYNNSRYFHAIYVVNFRHRDGRVQVWKYGITLQAPYTNRANVGKRACQVYFAFTGTHCWVDWVAVSNFRHGWYWARYLEASLIKQWNRQHGSFWQACPLGQSISCR